MKNGFAKFERKGHSGIQKNWRCPYLFIIEDKLVVEYFIYCLLKITLESSVDGS
jgi:hypothetical protein